MRHAANRIARGSGVYACRSCGRATRATGRGDNEHIRMCAECYDLGGIENAFADGCGTDADLREAERLIAALEAHGVTGARDLFDISN